MKRASELFKIASTAEQNIEVPLVKVVNDIAPLAEAAAANGQFSILIEFPSAQDEAHICPILRSWGFTFIKIKDQPQPRVLASWVNLTLNKISLI